MKARCEFPECSQYPTTYVLGIGLCWDHSVLMRKTHAETLRRLMNDLGAVTDDEYPPVANGMCNGVRDERDS